jgi:hypothetical protein
MSEDLSQYYSCSACDVTVFQLDLEVWPGIGAKHTAVIFTQDDLEVAVPGR